MSQQGNSLLKGTLILTAAGVIVKVIGSLNWIILSRVLGGEGIGLYQMAFPIYLLALSVSTAGVPVAISILTAEHLARQDYRGAARIFKISLAALTITGVCFSVLMFFGAEWLIHYRVIRDPRAYYSLVALAPAILFVTILASFRGYFQGWQIMTPTAVSQVTEQLFRVAAMLVFASLFLPMGLEYAAGGASLGAGFGAVAGLIVLVIYHWRLRSKFRTGPHMQTSGIQQEPVFAVIRRIAILAVPVSLSSIMLPVVANLDLMVVPARLEVAGYSVAQSTELFGYLTGMAVPLVNLFTILTASLATSLVPAVSESYAAGDGKLTYRRIAAAMRLTNIVTIPGAVGLWLLAQPIAEVIYNAPKAGESIRILAAGVFFLGIHQVSTAVLQGMGRTGIPVINMVVSAGIKVVLNWLLAADPTLGIRGAAWATVVDVGLAAFLNLYFVHKYTQYGLDSKNLLKISVAAGVMGGAMYAAGNLVEANTLSNKCAALAAVVIGPCVYGSSIMLTGIVGIQDIKKLPIFGTRMANLLQKSWLAKKDSE